MSCIDTALIFLVIVALLDRLDAAVTHNVSKVCAQAAENKIASISCPLHYAISSVIFASYGTPNGTCSNYTLSSCSAPTSVSVVRNLCLGGQTCSLNATNVLFGIDPCPLTFKRFYVAVLCSYARTRSATSSLTFRLVPRMTLIDGLGKLNFTFRQCQQACAVQGRFLAAIRTLGELAAAQRAVRGLSGTGFMIGANLLSGDNNNYRWRSGSYSGELLYNFTAGPNGSCVGLCNFAAGQPALTAANESVLVMAGNGQWYSIADGTAPGCMCEKLLYICGRPSSSASISIELTSSPSRTGDRSSSISQSDTFGFSASTSATNELTWSTHRTTTWSPATTSPSRSRSCSVSFLKRNASIVTAMTVGQTKTSSNSATRSPSHHSGTGGSISLPLASASTTSSVVKVHRATTYNKSLSPTSTQPLLSCVNFDALLASQLLPLFAAVTISSELLSSMSGGGLVNISLPLIGPTSLLDLKASGSGNRRRDAADVPCRLVFGLSKDALQLMSLLSISNTSSVSAISRSGSPCTVVSSPSGSSLVVSMYALVILAQPDSYASIQVNASSIFVGPRCGVQQLLPQDQVSIGSLYFPEVPATAAEVATNTATSSVATISSSVQLVAGNSGSNDLQVLAIIGLMQCSSTSVRNAFGNYRTLAPTKLEDSFLGVVLGNIALTAGVALLQLLVLVALRMQAFPDAWTQALIGKGDIQHEVPEAESSSWIKAGTAARFPDLILSAGIALYHGTIFGSGQLAVGQLDRKGTVISTGTRAFGIIALVALLIAPFVAVVSSRRLYREYFVFDAEKYFKRLPIVGSVVTRFFTPAGVFLPVANVRRFGTVFAAYSNPSPLWSLMPYFSSWLLTLASMMDTGSPASCSAMFATMAAIHALIAVIILVVRPYRIRARLALTVLQLIVTVLVLLLSAVAVRDAAALPQGAVVALGSIQAALTVASLASASAAFFFFRRLQHAEGRADGSVKRTLLWQQGLREKPVTTESFLPIEDNLFGLEIKDDVEIHEEEEEEEEEMLQLPSREPPPLMEVAQSDHSDDDIQENASDLNLSLTSSSSSGEDDDTIVKNPDDSSLPLLLEREMALKRTRRKRRKVTQGRSVVVRNPLLDLMGEDGEEEPAEDGEGADEEDEGHGIIDDEISAPQIAERSPPAPPLPPPSDEEDEL